MKKKKNIAVFVRRAEMLFRQSSKTKGGRNPKGTLRYLA